MFDIIAIPLGYLMRLCYTLINSYGPAIILFTLLTRLLLFPLSIWVQKNSVKMIRLQPELNEIHIKYMGNPDQTMKEQTALYKREGYKPLAGMIPTLIQIPIILGLISVVYHPLQHLLQIDPNVIAAFTDKATELLSLEQAGGAIQINIVELVRDPGVAAQFAALPVEGAAAAVETIRGLDMSFMGVMLSGTPSIARPDMLWLVPAISAASAFLLCVIQNKLNVLQKEAGWMGRWGMTIFLTAFSLFFAFIVPAGAGLYWICGNLFAILMLLLVNAMYPPKKYIDYDALEKSKAALAAAKAAEKSGRPTREQKARAKADYKKFFEDENKRLVFYSEKSGFYKYYSGIIDELIKSSDIVIHYVTSDPNDAIFKKDEPRIVPYYIDDNRLITLFMKMDADVVVMTMPDLQQYHIKRSLVRKDVEYVYVFHALVSTHMIYRKGSFDNYDTVLCVGPHHIREIRETEKLYGLNEKRLIEYGYPLLDDLRDRHKTDKKEKERFQVLIAPSHHEGNIMDSCIDEVLGQVTDKGFSVIVRPHPQYVKRHAAKISELAERYRDKTEVVFETDFSSNESIYTSDVMITDWSGIALEYSFTTRRPCLFINTPMKVLNPEYERIPCTPISIALRDKIGVSVDLNELHRLPEVIEDMRTNAILPENEIEAIAQETVYNIGSHGRIGAQYIIDELENKGK